jgi:uncharacterized protein (DUF1501 family)
MPILNEALLCPSRRVFLAGAGAFIAWANIPRMASAATRDPRMVVVILRGAMDGLAAVPPVGDPNYVELRRDLAIGTAGLEPTLPLDSFFGLNQSLAAFHDEYRAGKALIVHAAASPYRERSHFDGQDVLENGMTGPRAADTGWLNRAAMAMPAGDRVAPVSGLAATATVPLILRGPAPILTWTPPNFKPAGTDTTERLMDLYARLDPALAKVFAEGATVDRLAAGQGMATPASSGANVTKSFVELAEGAGRLLASDEGPRLAAISYDGWDTHAAEGAAEGRLANLLSALDASLSALKSSMGGVWSETAVVVITEFGRTARINGTEGTDHGTATTALLLGGAINGGRVVADWPGLKPAQLYEQRDLAPTIDLRAVLKGVMRDHLGLSETALATDVFPGSIGVKPTDGLIG